MVMDHITAGVGMVHLWGREAAFRQYIIHIVPRSSDNRSAMVSMLRSSLITMLTQVLMDESSEMKMEMGISDEMTMMKLSVSDQVLLREV